ncbi:MAG TPA: hypothetical protein VFZ42_16380 [Chitinophagaceae bacterium]
MNKDWIFFADKILNDLDRVYPRTKSYVVIRPHIDPRPKEHERPLHEALDFLKNHQLVDKINGNSYRITDKGRDVKTSGVLSYLGNLKLNDENTEIKETNSTYHIEQQLIDIKRKYKIWKYAAIAGVVSFIYIILEILDVL